MDISQITNDEAFQKRLLQERDIRFRKARKHSRRVRWLKILLPFAAIVISLGLIATTVIRSMIPANLSLESTTIENGMIVMTNPGMSGRNSKGIPYSLKAKRALLPVSDQDTSDILLEDVVAQIPLENETTAVVDATSAYYKRSNDQLRIDEPFTLTLSNGLTAHFDSAFIDVENGTLESNGPFSADSDEASVVAHSVNITDNGKRILFGGGVEVTLTPSALNKTGQ